MDDQPKLSDVIGGLVASMARARTVADMEALRIAYHYRQNEFLKGLPVPRLRLQRVSISMPVIVSQVLPGQDAQARQPAEIAERVVKNLDTDIEKIRAGLNAELQRESLPDAERSKLRRYAGLVERFDHAIHGAPAADPAPAVDRIYDLPRLLGHEIETAFIRLGAPMGEKPSGDRAVPSDMEIRQAASDATQKVLTAILEELSFLYIKDLIAQRQAGNDFDPDRARSWFAEDVAQSGPVRAVLEGLCALAASESVTVRTQAPDFAVSVNTDVIKTAGGGNQAITRLNLVLHEEGLEWVQESGADGSARLMPE